MKIITCTIIATPEGDTCIVPAEPLPLDSLRNVFDGEKYVIYEPGDDLPE